MIDTVELAKWARWAGRAVMVAAVAATVVALVLAGRFGSTARSALAVTESSVGVAGQSQAPLEQLAADLSALTVTVGESLDATRTLLADGADVVTLAADAASDNLAVTAEGAGDIADRVANLVETIEKFIPGNVDSAAEDLRDIADGLEPTAAQLRTLGSELEAAAAELRDADDVVAELGTNVDAIVTDLDALAVTVGQLGDTTAEVSAAVAETNDGLDTDLALLRVLIVLLGVCGVALGLGIDRVAAALTRVSPRPA